MSQQGVGDPGVLGMLERAIERSEQRMEAGLRRVEESLGVKIDALGTKVDRQNGRLRRLEIRDRVVVALITLVGIGITTLGSLAAAGVFSGGQTVVVGLP